MSIVKQYDKRSGITYVYESTSYWDKDKKQPRSHRVLIGRLDPDTGKIVPTDSRSKRRNQTNIENPAKRGPVPVTHTERLFYGATYLFDQIGAETGVTEDLKTCFPKTYKQMAVVYLTPALNQKGRNRTNAHHQSINLMHTGICVDSLSRPLSNHPDPF